MLEIKNLEMALEFNVYLTWLFKVGWQYWPWSQKQVIKKVEMIATLQAAVGFNMFMSEDPDNPHLSLWETLLYKLEFLAATIPVKRR